MPRPADLAALVRESVARAAGDPARVEGPVHLMVPLRADAMRRCLGNLLDNARKHAGRVEVRIEAPGGANWNRAHVLVDDDGPGIPESQREEAFRPFTSFSSGGTGLGLAIARDIARAHGGDLTLEGSPLGGLRARVSLPA
ncbi:sensor histidine kinase [Roseomonas sp. CCTCC AB2023176]|uniref:sensor histidine kinase n=1 Tax=Roseomonas sp. CCTCC AB2023176 TaxID=3342640 RepID=UPI0035E16660